VFLQFKWINAIGHKKALSHLLPSGDKHVTGTKDEHGSDPPFHFLNYWSHESQLTRVKLSLLRSIS
jgi:hypothetical protein